VIPSITISGGTIINSHASQVSPPPRRTPDSGDARLEDVIACNDLIFPVRRFAPDGPETWKQVVERGYEGYVDSACARPGPLSRLVGAVPGWPLRN
jgi:hypothetical protein